MNGPRGCQRRVLRRPIRIIMRLHAEAMGIFCLIGECTSRALLEEDRGFWARAWLLLVPAQNPYLPLVFPSLVLSSGRESRTRLRAQEFLFIFFARVFLRCTATPFRSEKTSLERTGSHSCEEPVASAENAWPKAGLAHFFGKAVSRTS